MCPPSNTPGGTTQPPSTDLVIAPGGPGPRSSFHLVGPGQQVSLKGGRVRIVEASTGQVVSDFGEIAASAPPQKTGWIEGATWSNTAAAPIIYFSTKWVVPPPPQVITNQTMYIWMGLLGSQGLLQPVLQWGYSPAPGGGLYGGLYWSITNWWVVGNTAKMAPPPVQVNPGEELQGLITCTAQSDGTYSYISAFVGYPQTAISVIGSDPIPEACQILEAYDAQGNPLTACGDYPNAVFTAMSDIEIQTGTPGTSGNEATIAWNPFLNYPGCGRHCVVVSNASPGGEVDLYYHQEALAQANAALACLYVTGTEPTSGGSRVYYIDESNRINELAWQGGWQLNPTDTSAPAFPGSALTCLYVGGSGSRVYYIGANSHIWELAFNNGWQATDTGAPALPGSALTCLYVGGSGSRVYYIGANSHIWELAFNNGWQHTDTGAPVPPGSALTCLYVGGSGSRVYYVGANSNIWELAFNNGWQHTDTGAPVLPGSTLTCLYVTGTEPWSGGGSRVYYISPEIFDPGHYVYELAWDAEAGPEGQGVWVPNYTGGIAKGGSPLTCLYIGGSGSRVYYIGTNNHIWESANNNGWQPATDTGVTPAIGSQLTCLYTGAAGSGTRVYYMATYGSATCVSELMPTGTGNWVGSPILA
jgi:hypothetical protein